MQALNNVLATSFVWNLKIFDVFIYIGMVKTVKIKFKSTENEEIIMTMIMTKTIITKIIITIMMRMRIKIGNRIRI